MTASPPLAPTLRRLFVPVYFPWAMSLLGASVLLPVLPLYLRDEGLSLTMVGLVIGASGLGSALGGLPASAIAESQGNDRLMFGALVVQSLAMAALGLTGLAVALIVVRVAYGLGQVGTGQSRQLYIARSVDTDVRGRVMSWVGGSHRFTLVIGPLLGGYVFERWGAEEVFFLAGGITSAALLWIVLPGGRDTHDQQRESTESMKVGPTLWRYRRLLARASVGPLLVMAARDGRYVVLPLIGDRLDLDGGQIGALVAVGTAADFLLFPAAGFVMDRFGRLASMIPAFTLMAMGLLLLGLADTPTQAVAAGIVIGVGNGLSSGAMLTMVTDLAPIDGRGPFIAGFNMISSTGRLLGPFVVGWAADTIGLGASAVALAVVLGLGLSWIVFVIGETGRTRVRSTT